MSPWITSSGTRRREASAARSKPRHDGPTPKSRPSSQNATRVENPLGSPMPRSTFRAGVMAIRYGASAMTRTTPRGSRAAAAMLMPAPSDQPKSTTRSDEQALSPTCASCSVRPPVTCVMSAHRSSTSRVPRREVPGASPCPRRSHITARETMRSSGCTRVSAPMRESPQPCVRISTGPAGSFPGISHTGRSRPSPVRSDHDVKVRRSPPGAAASSLGSPGRPRDSALA